MRLSTPCLILLCSLIPGVHAEDITAVDADVKSPAGAHAPFCLTTTWYPEKDRAVETENRILRELVRQGVLLSVRDNLGLVTRDESLGEPHNAPTADHSEPKQPLRPFNLSFEINLDGDWKARLFGGGTTYENPAWQHEAEVKFNKRTIYPALADQIVVLSAEIAAGVRTATGAEINEIKMNPNNIPDPKIERLLEEMNFVSQFAAVRAAHHAIAKDGTSIEWLGVLVRGYAHLAILTDHTWASHSEVFAARSLLYAEKLLQLSERNELAVWHRAYAFAVIGMHGAAIDEIEKLSPAKDELPAWTRLIAPYVKFDHAQLHDVSTAHPELAETAAFLQWNLYAAYRHGRWIYEQGLEAMEQCPEAYSVYSAMANWNALRIERIGSQQGMEAFAQLLPQRVAKIEGLPEQVRAESTERKGLLAQLWGGSEDSISNDRPIKIAKKLNALTVAGPPEECSWAILGQLIAEEQFLQVADMLKVSSNAVEYSKENVVSQVLPLIEGHPYAPLVQSYAFAKGEQTRRREVLGQLVVTDPKGNMEHLFKKAWKIPLADGHKGSYHSWRAVWGRNFTLNGMIESHYGSLPSWSFSSFGKDYRELFARDFKEISPYSPNARRLPMETGEKFSSASLATWEAELGEDPIGWLVLGRQYERIDKPDDARRAYRRSLKISPCMDATQALANMYYRDGDIDAWRETVESYLEFDDLSLAHAQVHNQIAWECLLRRDWKHAEPHALEAANTYSAWGLLLAGRIYEGMQDWEKSEKFVAAAAQGYPSSRGLEWYFWCRRTGRGDLNSARNLAEKHIEANRESTSTSSIQRAFVFHVLEDATSTGLAEMDAALLKRTSSESNWDAIRRYLYVIVACGDADFQERKAAALEQLRTLITKRFDKKETDWIEVLLGLCDILEGQDPAEGYFDKFDAVMADSNEGFRVNYWYFLGAALDQQGKSAVADNYLKKSAFSPGGKISNNVSLAGHRLVQKYGLERGGLPEDFAKIEAQIAAKDAEADTTEGEDAGTDDQSI